MSLQEILAGGGGVIFLLLTLVQISPIQINPFSWIAKMIGNALNKGVVESIEGVKKEVAAVSDRLEEHIQMDDERDANMHRTRILRFNTELLRNWSHTKEQYDDVMTEIDAYQKFCSDHPRYPNHRATSAIANITKTYERRLEEHDFL